MRIIVPLTVLLSIFALASCEPAPLPYLDVDFSAWELLTPEPITDTIPGHGSGVRNIFINDIGKEVSRTTVGARLVWDYPEGTIVLKTASTSLEEDSADEFVVLLGMVKDSEDPHSQGGWVWLTRDPRSGEETIFDTEYCIACHVDANERRTRTDRIPTGVPNPDREFRDFVFFPYYATE
jgi:cytochrome P460